MLTLNDPNGLKNGTNVYSINLELRMALPWQTSTGKWKYVNPDLDFLGIPDQSTAYVKRQARPGWTYVRRSSVTPDLIIPCVIDCDTINITYTKRMGTHSVWRLSFLWSFMVCLEIVFLWPLMVALYRAKNNVLSWQTLYGLNRLLSAS